MKINDTNDGVMFCGHMTESLKDIDVLLEAASRFDITLEEIEELRYQLASQETQGIKFDQLCTNDNECKKLQRLTSQYLTFLSSNSISTNNNYLDDEEHIPKIINISNINREQDNLMLAVKNHYCYKENTKESLNKFFIKKNRWKIKMNIVMPRISLSPFFINNEITEIESDKIIE